MKTQEIKIRVSEQDKAVVKARATTKGMTMSEYIIDLIRMDSEKNRMMLEQAAVKKIAEELQIEESDEITINTCRNGREVAWYLDESREMCIYIDTLEELTQEEIDKELA